MKKFVIFLSTLMLIVLITGVSVIAQTDFCVETSWDDSECSCSEPLSGKLLRIVIVENGVGTEHDSGWFSVPSAATSYNYCSNDTIRTDCQSDCYTVYASIAYIDSNQQECCSGAINEGATGQELVNGFIFSNSISME